MRTYFDHEKLKVYQEAIRFVGWTSTLLERVSKSMAAHNQLDRAGTSIPLNIAETVEEGKVMLNAVVSMLVGLVRSNHQDRVYEDEAEYRVRGEADYD